MNPVQPPIDRRALLRALPLLPFAGLAFSKRASTLASLRPSLDAVPFLGRTRLEPGRLHGSGLDGRLVFDLSRLVDDGLVVATEDFFIRTRVPASLERQRERLDDWVVRFSVAEDASGHLRDFGGADTDVSVGSLRERSRDLGEHLLECSGNSRLRSFGLLSMAEWSGVPLAELFPSTLFNASPESLLLVRGNDGHSAPSRSSVQGAGWIFTVDQLKRAGAFLATGINGEPLPLDHGAPVRLVVPGWYGCACIKWVESIEVVDPDAPSTSQMREFAGRTEQDGIPEPARQYKPAEIDFAAMPILVEGPDLRGRYLVTGLAWGSPTGVKKLLVRFAGPGCDEWQTVDGFVPQQKSSWTLWRHAYRPTRSGEYEITLRVGESEVRTRRLDRGYYARRVRLAA